MLKRRQNFSAINQKIFWTMYGAIDNSIDYTSGESQDDLFRFFLRDDETLEDEFYFFDVVLV